MTSDEKERGQQPGVGIQKRETTAGVKARRGFFASARRLLAVLLLSCLLAPVASRTALAQTPSAPAGKPSAKKASRSAHRKSAARRSPRISAKKSSAARKTSSRRRKAAASARRQLHPTPERYAQIQSALAREGYYQEPANGAWGQSSVDALQRFQEEHGLEPTGKIDALSLIKLNLGPQYNDKTAAANAVTSDK